VASCDTCKTPGNCCSGFTLNFDVDEADWKLQAEVKLKSHGIDYWRPVRISRTSVHLQTHSSGKPFQEYKLLPGRVRVMFSCDRLTKEGKCGDYENRPITCKDYEPGYDPLCAMYQPTLKGIPIMLEGR